MKVKNRHRIRMKLNVERREEKRGELKRREKTRDQDWRQMQAWQFDHQGKYHHLHSSLQQFPRKRGSINRKWNGRWYSSNYQTQTRTNTHIWVINWGWSWIGSDSICFSCWWGVEIDNRSNRRSPWCARVWGEFCNTSIFVLDERMNWGDVRTCHESSFDQAITREFSKNR